MIAKIEKLTAVKVLSIEYEETMGKRMRMWCRF